MRRSKPFWRVSLPAAVMRRPAWGMPRGVSSTRPEGGSTKFGMVSPLSHPLSFVPGRRPSVCMTNAAALG
jgi:hypothetical protein